MDKHDGQDGPKLATDSITEAQMGWRHSFQGEALVATRSRRSCTPSDWRSSMGTADQSRCTTLKSNFRNEAALSWRKHTNSIFHQYRFVVASMTGLCCGLMLLQRYSITISILQMVNQTHLYLEEHPNKTIEDFYDEGLVPGGEFLWNNEIVAIILGWYMFSYTLPQTFASKFNSLIGCRLAIPLGLAVCSISNLLVPTVAYWGWHWVVTCRLLNGLGAAGSLPGMITLLEDWMPYDELSLGLTISTLVFSFICAIHPLAAGYLTAIHWSWAFYVPSYVTLATCVPWLILITNKPESNWLISERELNYIINQDKCQPTAKQQVAPPPSETKGSGGDTQLQTVAANAADQDDDDQYKPSSWLQLLKLPSMYAYTIVWIVDCSCSSGFSFVLPAYMRQFLKIPISENGFYCTVIQFGCVLAIAWPHKFLQCLLSSGMSLTRARIYSQLVCSLAIAGTYFYVGFFHQYQLPLFFLNRCFMSGDIILTGSVMSNFAKAGLSSIVFAMINTLGNLSLTGVSPLIGWWLDFTASSSFGWQVVFCSLGAGQLLIFLIFALFIDSDPIKFKKGDKSNNNNKQNIKSEL